VYVLLCLSALQHHTVTNSVSVSPHCNTTLLVTVHVAATCTIHSPSRPPALQARWPLAV
jgi:hypothetical protein